MNHTEVGLYWNQNAEAWTHMARAGYDKCRDLFNTPCFLAMLPDVTGLRGLDIGCGEGHNTRMVARRGASMKAVDIATTFVAHARAKEAEEPLGIEFHEASAVDLPFPDASFDFATAFMSIMDLPEQEAALAEAFRVVKPGGFFQLSICHPCFDLSQSAWARDEQGRRVGLTCRDYFAKERGEIEEWTFSQAPPEVKSRYPKFKIPRFPRTLSSWLNLLVDTGFAIERVGEPHADDETIARHPEVAHSRIVAFFLILRGRKPG